MASIARLRVDVVRFILGEMGIVRLRTGETVGVIFSCKC